MTKKKKIAVVLCGAGFKDGSEIHEATCTLLNIAKSGATYFCFAPSADQKTVVNHATGHITDEHRNMLTEAARIARGQIKPITELQVSDFDALIFPGGFGLAKNLCDFAEKGAQCTARPDVEKVILDFYKLKKPLGFICIAPALAARVLGQFGVELTIGTDDDVATKLGLMGAIHKPKAATEIHMDELNRVVSTPAYMSAQNIAEVDAGVSKLVQAILKMV